MPNLWRVHMAVGHDSCGSPFHLPFVGQWLPKWLALKGNQRPVGRQSLVKCSQRWQNRLLPQQNDLGSTTSIWIQELAALQVSVVICPTYNQLHRTAPQISDIISVQAVDRPWPFKQLLLRQLWSCGWWVPTNIRANKVTTRHPKRPLYMPGSSAIKGWKGPNGSKNFTQWCASVHGGTNLALRKDHMTGFPQARTPPTWCAPWLNPIDLLLGIDGNWPR